MNMDLKFGWLFASNREELVGTALSWVVLTVSELWQ